MSPRFLADENVEPDLVLGLKRRVEGIDIKTVPTFAHARVVAGAPAAVFVGDIFAFRCGRSH